MKQDASLSRTVLTGATLGLATLALGPPVIALGSAGFYDQAQALIRLWSRALLKAVGVRIHSQGVERARGLGPCVIMSSHRSHLDGPILLCTLPFSFTFVIKQSLARVPLWGAAVRKAGYIPIDRGDHANAMKAMEQAAQMVRSGRRVLTFPEGTRSERDDFKPLKKGGFVLAIEAQVPILPVVVVGSFDLLPKRSRRVRSGDVFVNVGHPVSTEELTYEQRDDLLHEVEAILKELYQEGRLRLERARKEASTG